LALFVATNTGVVSKYMADVWAFFQWLHYSVARLNCTWLLNSLFSRTVLGRCTKMESRF